jgi:hypothetical protein
LNVRPPVRNLFIGYNNADLPWAEWIACQLDAAGCTTTVQAWGFRSVQQCVRDSNP